MTSNFLFLESFFGINLFFLCPPNQFKKSQKQEKGWDVETFLIIPCEYFESLLRVSSALDQRGSLNSPPLFSFHSEFPRIFPLDQLQCQNIVEHLFHLHNTLSIFDPVLSFSNPQSADQLLKKSFNFENVTSLFS